MAGGVANWVEPDDEAAVFRSDENPMVFSRGGAWCDWPEDCAIPSRRSYLPTEFAARVGFRLARDL
jgi:formylglycine-generating enzyme required for sulfatase activity